MLLGVNQNAALNVFDPSRGTVGLQFVPTGNDSTRGGAPYEAWGVADAASGVSGEAYSFNSNNNLTVQSFQATGNAATSVVTVGNPLAPTFRVTHQFAPSPSTPNLYVVRVTIQNLTDATIQQVLYRRVVDWDVEPTPFSELVTIAHGDATAILGSSDGGFNSANPLSPRSGTPGPFTDRGPSDLGLTFDLGLGALRPGGTLEFLLYFGAAASQAEAEAALGEVGAEAYSFGQTSDGGQTGAPNTFILGFSNIGGTPIFADPTPDPVDPTDDDPASNGSDAVPASAEVKQVSAAVTTSAQLPATGASLGLDVAPLGLLLIVAGSVVLAISRRRGSATI